MNNFNRFISFKIVILTTAALMTSCSSLNFFENDSVPKEKYEELLQKYKNLVSEKIPSVESNQTTIDDSREVESLKAKLINSHDESRATNESYDLKRVQKDISMLYQAYDKYNQKKFGDVIILLKELENSQVDKVRAQSRYLLAMTMKTQGELDLSLQIFEEIVIKMRNSIFAQLSLEHLIDNAKKLGLKNKQSYFTQLYARFLR